MAPGELDSRCYPSLLLGALWKSHIISIVCERVGTESFGNDLGNATVIAVKLDSQTTPAMTPDMGCWDDWIEFLKCYARGGLIGIPQTGKPEAVKVGPKTNCAGSVGRNLQV